MSHSAKITIRYSVCLFSSSLKNTSTPAGQQIRFHLLVPTWSLQKSPELLWLWMTRVSWRWSKHPSELFGLHVTADLWLCINEAKEKTKKKDLRPKHRNDIQQVCYVSRNSFCSMWYFILKGFISFQMSWIFSFFFDRLPVQLTRIARSSRNK